jgi:DDE family transposase
MTQTNSTTYSTQTIAQELGAAGLPFAAFLARALTALLTGRNASVHRLANLLPGEADAEAKRQQIRRVLDQPTLRQATWAGTVAALLPTPAPWVLALDRTEWWMGHKPVNLLVLAVVCAGCAVPVGWMVLEKTGASDTNERIALLQAFLARFGKHKIRFVTADREFIGADWIAWLLQAQVPFRIRIKAGEYLLAPDGTKKRAGEWFQWRACSCKKRRMWLWGLPVFVGGKRLRRNREEFLIVVSSQASDLLEEYRLRWKIETLFQAFKGRGFEMESSRLTEPVRLSCWFGFLSLALVWCLRVGQFREHTEPLRLKKHGRLAQSLFHRGLSELQSLLAPLSGRACESAFVQAVRQLRPAELK